MIRQWDKIKRTPKGHKEKARGYYILQPNKGMSKCVKQVKVMKIVSTVRTREQLNEIQLMPLPEDSNTS